LRQQRDDSELEALRMKLAAMESQNRELQHRNAAFEQQLKERHDRLQALEHALQAASSDTSLRQYAEAYLVRLSPEQLVDWLFDPRVAPERAVASIPILARLQELLRQRALSYAERVQKQVQDQTRGLAGK